MAKNMDLPIMMFSGQQDFEDWLAHYHETSEGILLRIAKKDSTINTILCPIVKRSTAHYVMDGLIAGRRTF